MSKNLSCIRLHTEVKPAYVQGPSAGGNRCMGRAHIARHFASAGKITPRGEHRDHTIGLFLPDKPTRTVRAFLTRGRGIESDLDGVIKKVDCLIIFCQNPKPYKDLLLAKRQAAYLA